MRRVGGRSVGSTSGLAFSVRGNLNRLTCSGVLLVSAYFRCGGRSKIAKNEKSFSNSKFSEFSACHNFLPLWAWELQLKWEVNRITSYIYIKFDPLPVKADIVTEVSFPVFRHVGDVTVGGRSVGSTSGLAFSVRGNLNRLTCSGVLLVSAYFRCGGRSKIAKKRTCTAHIC